MRKHAFFLIMIFVFLSCVPIRKIQYLQNKGELKENKPSTDTALRTYNVMNFDYKVQTNDIISVRYFSLTEEKYDFLGQGSGAGGASGGSSGGSTGTTTGTGGALLRGELVDTDGDIPMPFVGKVKVSGLTVFQVQDTLQKLANLYLASPIVKVRLLNYRATILGEVNQEGTVTFNENRVSLMEAIGLAGGLGELADRSNVKVVRQVNSKSEVFYVNLLSEDFIRSPFYYVHQNDLIVVPPLKQRTFRRYFTQNISLFLSAASIVLLIITLDKLQ
jgi:polysaccharide biosynthesis/export protein